MSAYIEREIVDACGWEDIVAVVVRQEELAAVGYGLTRGPFKVCRSTQPAVAVPQRR